MLNYRAEDTEIMRENDAYGISFATPSATIKAVLNDFYTKEGLDTSFTVDTLVRGSIFSDLSVIEKAMERDNFMTPDEAKKFGLVDHIVTSREDVMK